MKITWLGQAGLLVEHRDVTLLIDPYLSNSCGEKNPKSFRRVPVDESFLALKPTAILLTHDHLDHTDEATLSHYLTDASSVLVLAAPTAWEHVRAFGGSHNYVRFSRHTEWSIGGLRIAAVKAEHSDPQAIGVILDDGAEICYVTGDTLYNTEILADLPPSIDVILLPINGKGNNMNAEDAARFAEKTGARVAVPLHFGMLDEIDPTCFKSPNRVIPEIYREIPIHSSGGNA